VSDSPEQIPLAFKQNTVQTFSDFTVGNNSLLIDSLHSFAESSECIFYLWGESGSGKSHVLQAFINRISIDGKTAVILNSEDLRDRQSVSLIEMFDYICIDSVEKVAGDALLEESLFFWINEVRQAHKKILIAGQYSNKSNAWQLPDLCSRIQSGRTYEIIALERDEVFCVFNKLVQKKGIIIDQKVMAFLKKNCPMNLSFLSILLDKLDKITLVEKKQVTIPLLKKILESKLVK
jgi:DnaA family protein